MADTGAFAAYMQAQEHTARMFAEYNSAQRGLELAQIRERAAEVRSQYEPLATVLDRLGLSGLVGHERDRARLLLCGLVEYVAHGRALEAK